MASYICTVSKTQASTKSNHHSRNIVVVKGTAHRRLKEICAKATVIALASFDVGHFLKKKKKKKKDEEI